jgi:hypothetical protein
MIAQYIYTWVLSSCPTAQAILNITQLLSDVIMLQSQYIKAEERKSFTHKCSSEDM